MFDVSQEDLYLPTEFIFSIESLVIPHDSILELQQENRTDLDLVQKKRREVAVGIADLKDEKDIPYTRLIQINITRFGSILLILFFVKIIIPQYRYCIRLANYYDARADALMLFSSGFKETNFEILVSSLTPNYEFGNSPETPYEKIIELLNLVKKQ